MMEPSDRILVGVSGGKDSLALWDILIDLGYSSDGLYLNLGIGTYSDRSQSVAEKFAENKGVKLHTISLRQEYGFGIPEGSRVSSRPTCSLCGMSKRHILNKFAYDHGYDVLATGHNLDDEAATLLSNLIRWEVEYLRRQWPVLPAREGFVKKVKPLVRLEERETAAYCVLSGIDYIVEECPLVAGNTQLEYKESLALLERRSAGTKARLVFGFLAEGQKLFGISHKTSDNECSLLGSDSRKVHTDLVLCAECGSPTPTGSGDASQKEKGVESKREGGDFHSDMAGISIEKGGENRRSGAGPFCAFCRESAKIGAAIVRARSAEET